MNVILIIEGKKSGTDFQDKLISVFGSEHFWSGVPEDELGTLPVLKARLAHLGAVSWDSEQVKTKPPLKLSQHMIYMPV